MKKNLSFILSAVICALGAMTLVSCNHDDPVTNELSAYEKAIKAGDYAKALELDKYIAPMSEAIYGVGQPSGEAHARMKEALYQRGIFSSPLMLEPVMPIKQKEKDQVTAALKEAGLIK